MDLQLNPLGGVPQKLLTVNQLNSRQIKAGGH
jgi:hypothetical protein